MRPGATDDRARALLLAGALALLTFLLVPASLYLGNLRDFRFAPLPVAQVLAVPILVLALLGIAVARLLPRNASRLCAALATLTLLSWTQAYLLVWDYGPLDGQPIDWSVGGWRGLVDLPLWVAGLGLALKFHERLARPLATAALCLVALQAVVVVADGLRQRQALAEKSTRRFPTDDLDAVARFSPERNVVHILLDSLQSDVFHEAVTGPGGPRLQAALGGFTWFEEHLGTYPATHMALPVIVSGRVYRNDIPMGEYHEAAYERGSILRAARQAGFEVDIVAESWMLDELARGGVDHAYVPSEPSRVVHAARLLDLALFRAVPHVVKRFVYNDQNWLAQRLLAGTNLMMFPYFSHNAFLDQLVRRFAADRPRPVYKFFHLTSTHAPFVANPDCSFAGRALEATRAAVVAQSRCSLSFVAALLERLRQAGIYEDSLIVIMADHGGWLGPPRYRHGTFGDARATYDLDPRMVGLATPLLAIKPPGAANGFNVSASQTSMTDVAATIDALAGFGAGLPGRSVMEPREPAVERRYHGYAWTGEQHPRYLPEVVEYLITGTAYDARSWHAGEVLRQPETTP
jgi:hypothetical protein